MRERGAGALRLLLIALLLQPFRLAHGDDQALMVLYPMTVSEADGQLLRQVIEGIESAVSNQGILTYQTVENDGLGLRRFLRDRAPTAVITLGRSSHDLYRRHRRTIDPEPIVGALDITSDTHPQAKGVGMNVAPGQLFMRLKLLAPEVSRILVVYDPHRDTSTVQRAMSAASEHGLMLKGFQAMDANQSSRHFSNLFRYANPLTDAVWLQPDVNLIRTDTHLPEIVEQSWGRRFVVFSSNADHADRGVLFAVYPDAKAVGEALVGIASQQPQERTGLQPLEQVESSLNLRFARHLDLETPRSTRRHFDHLVREN